MTRATGVPGAPQNRPGEPTEQAKAALVTVAELIIRDLDSTDREPA